MVCAVRDKLRADKSYAEDDDIDVVDLDENDYERIDVATDKSEFESTAQKKKSLDITTYDEANNNDSDVESISL